MAVTDCVIAGSRRARLRGLIGRAPVGLRHGLLLVPCRSIHTGFMRHPIDVVFLDRGLRVVAVRPDLRPWRAASHRRAHAVLELPAGRAAALGIEEGVRVEPRTPR